MRVLDTSVWIEWLADTPLGKTLGREFQEKINCLVPTLVQLELAKWLLRERNEDDADRVIAFTQKCEVVPLDSRIAIQAAHCCREYKLATADAIIYATALEHSAELLTCDAHFEKLPGVRYFRKPTKG